MRSRLLQIERQLRFSVNQRTVVVACRPFATVFELRNELLVGRRAFTRSFSALPNADLKQVPRARKRRAAILNERKKLGDPKLDQKRMWPPLRRKTEMDKFFNNLLKRIPFANIRTALTKLKKYDKKKQMYLHLTEKLETLPPNSTALPVLEFLFSTKTTRVKSKDRQTMISATQLEKDVESLVISRERAIKEDLLFSIQQSKKMAEYSPVKVENRRQERLLLHNAKTAAQLKSEAGELRKFLEQSVPPKVYRSIMGFFESYSESLSERRSPRSVIRLEPRIRPLAGRYYHLIASTVSEFLYIPLWTYNRNPAIRSPAVLQSIAQWEEARSVLVSSLLDIQQKLALGTAETDDESEVEDTLHGLSLKPEKSKPKRSQDKRFRRQSHLIFNATALVESAGQVDAEVHSTTPALASQTMIFLDNLPIDIDEMEIRSLYSRCGEVKSVSIFNQRRELDPGALTTRELLQQKKEQIQNVKKNAEKWQRPRTPLYALLAFHDHQGYLRALDDSLRIFGMIIRRHPVRSIRSKDMKSLFIEGIAEGGAGTDFEYILGTQLYPDLFVSLNAGQDSRSLVGSCELRLPSFEHALAAFHRLQDLELIKNHPDCTINWMRTPADADKWWRRKRGFH